MEEMTVEEAEDIVMAWQVGANYPEDKLPLAILLLTLTKREGEDE